MPSLGQSSEGQHQRHVVVFDVNIYLDVAALLGSPFTWGKFDEAVASLARVPVPHPINAAYDSLRAIAISTSGRFKGAETLEVYTNSHIDKMVRGKTQQPTKLDATTGYRGLGWGREDANGLVTDLIDGLLERSVGGTLGDTFPDGNPPLDHEDGMVYGACKVLAGNDPLSTMYCVTRDNGFIAASKDGKLANHTKVLHPTIFLQLVRAARARHAMPMSRSNS